MASCNLERIWNDGDLAKFDETLVYRCKSNTQIQDGVTEMKLTCVNDGENGHFEGDHFNGTLDQPFPICKESLMGNPGYWRISVSPPDNVDKRYPLERAINGIIETDPTQSYYQTQKANTTLHLEEKMVISK
eukprot:maker-scaffold133_size323035-snap-gene-0.19 protein:Tk02230 transcript:maker-scaffold133_size323035-snap-gene-0.19-mRNA-1 annotation:"hypothetical protein"